MRIVIRSRSMLWIAAWQLALAASAILTLAESLQECIEKGRQAEERYFYAEALSWFRQAVSLDARNPEWHFAIARQLIGLEKLEEACNELNETIKLNPAHAEAYTMLGIYQHKVKDDLAAAEKQYLLAIQADPKHLRSRKLLAELYISLHRFEDSQKLYEAILHEKPSEFDAYEGLGKVLLQRSQTDQAIDALKQAIALKPEEPEPYRLLGQALARLGQRAEAQELLKQYQKVKEGQNRLIDQLRAVRRSPKNPGVWFNLGKEYLKRKETWKAIDAYETGVELDAENEAAHGLLGALYIQERLPVYAQWHLEKAITFDPGNPNHFNNLAVSFMLQGKFAQAAQFFEIALELGGPNPGILKNLDLALDKLKPTAASPEKKP
ncbi:MAG: tetratricopeptide repeat protein [Candidatus Omnitrophota bacterium]